MQYGRIGGLSQESSRIVLGTDSFADGDRTILRLLDAAYDLGVNAFESARSYGSEELLGRWVTSRRLRANILLLTKGGFPGSWSAQQIRSDCDASLKALRTEYIDSYLLHYDCPVITIDEIVSILGDLQRTGKIRTFGFSNFNLERLCSVRQYCRAYHLPERLIVSVHYGLIPWTTPYWPGAQSLAGPSKRIERAWHAANGDTVLAYSPLGRGFFKTNAAGAHRPRDDSPQNRERYRRALEIADARGVSAAQIALAFLFDQSSNTFAIIGTQNPVHLRDNAQASSIVLTAEERAWLDLET